MKVILHMLEKFPYQAWGGFHVYFMVMNIDIQKEGEN